jgi:hypothetical protein
MKRTLVDTRNTKVTDDYGNVIVLCKEFDTLIQSDLATLEKRLYKATVAPESEYATWGGKRGAVRLLKEKLRTDNQYLTANRELITKQCDWYQHFIECAIEYEILKSVVTDVPINILDTKSARHYQ